MPDFSAAAGTLDRPSPAPCFSWLRSDTGGVARLTLEGELDAFSSSQFESALEGAQVASASVVVDLEHLAFLDCGGLRVLLAAAERSRLAGTHFAVLPGPPQVERLFDIVDTGPALQRVTLRG